VQLRISPNSEQPAGDADRTGLWIEFAIRLAALALVLYWSWLLVRPFTTIAIWAVVLTVALYPVYERLIKWIGGRRRLGALVITILSLLVVLGPATWLVLSLIDSLRTLSGHFDLASYPVPPAPERLKEWPLVGEPLYQMWDLAATNFRAAFARLAPHLKPLGSSLLEIAAGATGDIIQFLLSIVAAGFLFAPAPSLVRSVRRLALRIAAERGEEFLDVAVKTIRAVSRGVIGISALQALLVGLGLLAAGVPAASLITSAVLIFGIVQIGASVVLVPLVIWAWMTMATKAALLFTAYMVPVGLLDNVLKPLVLGRGLSTPALVILIGVVGGTVAYGIVGLFLGPIVLAVIWQLLLTWTGDLPVVSAAALTSRRGAGTLDQEPEGEAVLAGGDHKSAPQRTS
jgi:predicted PurR-regulated permease PerM